MVSHKKRESGEFPGGPGVKNPQGARVPPLVGKLRSCMPKKEEEKKKEIQRGDHVKTQQERPQNKSTLPTPASQTFSFQTCKKIHFCCLSAPGLWYFAKAAPADACSAT